MILESLASDFDWNYFLAGAAWRVQAFLCALRLAEQVLGASLKGTPVAPWAPGPTSWMLPTLLREWSKGSGRREPVAPLLRRPWTALREAPRLPFQLAFVLARAFRLLVSLIGSPWRGRRAGGRS